jgi:hypothetical protein
MSHTKRGIASRCVVTNTRAARIATAASVSTMGGADEMWGLSGEACGQATYFLSTWKVRWTSAR